MSGYKVGDLYWRQLSMWDFSKKNHVDTYSKGGFHYELFIVTEVISINHWRPRHVEVGELSENEIAKLIPESGNICSRVMGNNADLIK